MGITLKICFAMPGVYPMLYGGVGPFGGSELRAWRLAHCEALGRLGSVSMIGFDVGQKSRELREGLLHLRDDTQPLGTSRWRRWRGYFARRGRDTELCRKPSTRAWETIAWKRADADVYVTFGVTGYSAKLAWWAKTQGKLCLLMMGSEMDLDPAEQDAATIYDNATMVVAQTEYQRHVVQTRFGRSTRRLRNPVVIPELAPTGPRRGFLWVGKSNDIKRPDLFVEIARLMPQHAFTLVMNKADATVDAEVRRTLPANARIIDSVAPHEMGRLYGGVIALVSTSRIEGFANSFLEAAAHRTPIVSMVSDPDGFLGEHGCGVLAGESPASVAAALRGLVAENGDMSAEALRMGSIGRDYVERWHAASVIEAEFASLVASCATGVGAD
ncbi:MAG: glycosyltransferase family 4 protein [Azospirillum sp.]|nr:glycosyltransferase family 4 protein [Azospirillum sp.]